MRDPDVIKNLQCILIRGDIEPKIPENWVLFEYFCELALLTEKARDALCMFTAIEGSMGCESLLKKIEDLLGLPPIDYDHPNLDVTPRWRSELKQKDVKVENKE